MILDPAERMIRKVYGQNHPDHHGGVGEPLTTGCAGRPRSRRHKEGPAPRQTAANNPAVAAEVCQGIMDLMDIAGAPGLAFAILDGTPDAGLTSLREQVKRAARSADWKSAICLKRGSFTPKMSGFEPVIAHRVFQRVPNTCQRDSSR